ncbi:hypothetical protein HMPREF1531_00464 [Propionibacterium sp. oral taxon 192 str. F0372]|nr:hypothetical protein HMPREF1531_00464 [Propionibacterium sp. oral taxon 192 str. F0372]
MRMRRWLVIAGLVSITAPTSMAVADDPVGNASDLSIASASSGPLDSGQDAGIDQLKQLDERVTVMVELPKAPVAAAEAKNGGDLDQSGEKSVRDDIASEQDRIVPAIEALGGSIEFRMQSAYNGMRVSIDSNRLSDLEKLEGIKQVHAITQHDRSSVVSVPYIGAPVAWQGNGFAGGYTGENVKVAIVDSGIDYTHATFGGPGTVAAFDEATAVNDQSKMAGTRVKGGYDFAGDAYNGDNTPVPDENPIDCAADQGGPAGHGTHVANIAAGSGVRADGSTYTGPYDENTHTDNEFAVGPGVAPEADIYAVRVFGCSGTTNLVTEAMDWAVAHDMDVVNLSLGSSFGRVDSPDAVAVSNAVAAGVVVVAASGNSGAEPYLTGSPGTGAGVVSVAANDSAATYPSADLKVGASTIEAININGAELPAKGKVKVLREGDQIANGCYAPQWDSAKVRGQIVVVRRDAKCASIQRVVHGQKYGAAAVIMVNSADELPPFIGEISRDTGTGDPFKVTIPFLGVKSSAAEALLGADDKKISLTKNQVANPGYTDLAAFTSAGPRSGDSAVRPTVTAPGVRISSAVAGSGNKAQAFSGTSMATPHASGAAALARQAHPDWTSQEIAAAMVSTSDTDRVANHSPSLGGGLINPIDVVYTSVFAYSDSTTVDGTQITDAGISFGYAEFVGSWTGDRVITLVNKGDQPVTLHGVIEPSRKSLPASVTLGSPEVTVPAGGTAKVPVTMTVQASDVPSSMVDPKEQNFHEVSGIVRLTTDAGQELTLPYLLAPRVISKVSADQTFKTATQSEVTLANKGGGIEATSVLFTLGLQDPADIPDDGSDVGQDISSVGVTSFKKGEQTYLDFAVNSSSRFSNPASIIFSITIDKDLDGVNDYLVYSEDAGVARGVRPVGYPEIFIQDLKTNKAIAAGFLPLAPSDSSSIILEIKASDVGVNGKFAYGAKAASTGDRVATDVVNGTAYYDPTNKAFADGQLFRLAPDARQTVELAVNETVAKDLGVLGYMVLALDNAQGATEAVTGPLTDPKQAAAVTSAAP